MAIVVASLIDAGHSDCKGKTVCAWPEFAAWLVELCGFSWIATEVFAIYSMYVCMYVYTYILSLSLYIYTYDAFYLFKLSHV